VEDPPTTEGTDIPTPPRKIEIDSTQLDDLMRASQLLREENNLLLKQVAEQKEKQRLNPSNDSTVLQELNTKGAEIEAKMSALTIREEEIQRKEQTLMDTENKIQKS
jgi:hypothetical protein